MIKEIDKRNLIIDSRIREEEEKFLADFFNIIKLTPSSDVYSEISGHSDIFYCKIDDKIICSPNAKFIDKSFIVGNLPVKEKYPEDVRYNVCQIGDILVANKYTDKKILENWNKEVVIVNQGYTKCSLSVTSNNSCITSDRGIEKALRQKGIKVTLISEDNISLLDDSKMNGFIGGATFVFDNKFVLFGDFNYLKKENQETIIENLNENNLELVYFKNLKIRDYGGAIIF